jgi:hypothetical protein
MKSFPNNSRIEPLNLKKPVRYSSRRDIRWLFPLRSHSDGRGEGQDEVRVQLDVPIDSWKEH